MNIHRPLIAILAASCPTLFLACFGDDTTANPDGGSVDASDASDTSIIPDVRNPFPDGYPSFVDGDDSSDGFVPDTGPCTPVDVPYNGLPYGGGPVILGTVNVYLIWYGDWSYSPNTSGLVSNLITGLSGSPYFNINTGYYQLDGKGVDGNPVGYQFNRCGSVIYGDAAPTDAAYPFWYPSYVSGQVKLAQSINDSYSYGHFLQDPDVWSIVSHQLDIGALPTDSNGVYFVLASKDVTEGAQCLAFCGWHNGMPFGDAGAYIKYAFVGDPSACPGTCDEWGLLEDAGADASPSTPNGDFAADSMASVIAHELEEATTDPGLNAWMGFEENADKCAWNFGPTFDSNGAPANQSLGGRDYLIQMNWVLANGGFCAQHL